MSYLKLANEAYKLKLLYAAEAPVPPSCLYAARRDSAAFQLILCSDEYYSVNIARGEWISARGDKHITAPLRHERLRVDVDAPFPVKLHIEEFLTDDDNIQKADMLLAQNVRESDPHKPTAVWVELCVPEDAVPGDYTVTVRLYSAFSFEDEVLLQTETLPLHVASFLLPAPKERKFFLDLWQHNSNIARKHDVPLWSDAHFAVMEKYVKTLADLGQRSITICASEIPWSGQSCFESQEFGGNLFEFSIIPITRERDGSFSYDFSLMQRYIDLCTKAGFSGDIEVFGLVNLWTTERLMPNPPCTDYPEAIRLRYYDRADGCMKYIREGEQVKTYVRALEKYFIDTDQIERVRVAADEPADVDKYRESLNLLHEIAPRFHLKTAINHVEFIEEFGDRIDDFVPHLRSGLKGYESLCHYRAKYPEKRFLWYVCTGSIKPNTFLRSALTEARMIGTITSVFRFDGFLRWNYTIWPEDPRRELRCSRWEAGDTNFVYPAYNGDVLLSLRYKNLQRGLADYELLETVRDRFGDEVADGLAQKLMHVQDAVTYYALSRKNIALFCYDWEKFNAHKAEMLRLLEA